MSALGRQASVSLNSANGYNRPIAAGQATTSETVYHGDFPRQGENLQLVGILVVILTLRKFQSC
jgi:hypothetical protein